MTHAANLKSEKPPSRLRFRLGLAILIVGWLSPLLIPVVTRTSLAAEWKTIVSGLLAVGIPEVFTVAAMAILGKSGFNLIKERMFSFIKKHGPPDRVSPTRYRIGLVMFVLPIVFGWLGYETHRLVVSMIGDLMFVASLFVLGGDFWDKVRALFVHGARAQFNGPG